MPFSTWKVAFRCAANCSLNTIYITANKCPFCRISNEVELFPGKGHELSWNRREFFNCDQVQFFDPRELALLLGKDQPNYIHGMQDQVALVAVYNALRNWMRLKFLWWKKERSEAPQSHSSLDSRLFIYSCLNEPHLPTRGKL